MDISIWKTLRELNGLSQSALTAKAAINQSHYSHIERGQASAGAKTIAKLLSALVIPPAIQPALLQEGLEALDTRWDSTDRQRMIRLAEVLDEAWPGWVADTLRALYHGGPPQTAISRDAHAGLLWIVAAGTPRGIPWVAIIGEDDPAGLPDPTRMVLDPTLTADAWRAACRELAEYRDVAADDPQAVADVAEITDVASTARWESLRSEWMRLSFDQQYLVARLIEELNREKNP